MASQPPEVSVIIPVYESQQTLSASLTAFEAQDYPNYEIIVVDSSPSDLCNAIIQSQFPSVRYERSQERLLPHAARNLGVEKSSSEMLVFTDPDVYPDPGWLSALVAADSGSGDVVVGSVSCYGDRWIDLGVHLSKFDSWLPGGAHRWIDIAPTVNMLCHRRTFEEIGGFPAEHMIGDTVFSWRLVEAGYRILFAPEAELPHHHLSDLNALMKERIARGEEFGWLRMDRDAWKLSKKVVQLGLSIVPVRWARLIARVARNAATAGMLDDYFRTLPIIMLAQAAWLLGESRAYVESISKSGSR
jgi:GT2 family glycosyltransferase